MHNHFREFDQIQLDVFGKESAYAERFYLKEGETLFAGKGASCGIQLAGANIEPFHCMFGMTDGQIVIQDCETGGKTRVNGSPVETETTCRLGDTIEIGHYQVVLSPFDPPVDNASIETAEEAVAVQAVAEIPELAASEDVCEPDIALANEPNESWDKDLPVETELELNERDDSWFDLEATEDQAELPNLLKDEMELLRSEVEFLQSELIAKEQEIANLRLGSANDALAETSETEKLVGRLEELLAELQASDERVKSLEDLLHLSDEATRAEQEERRQIESWLSEIEERVEARESELEAENDALKRQLESTQARQKKAESQLRKMLGQQPSSAVEGSEHKVVSAETEQRIAQLERLVETANHEKAVAEAKLKELEEASANAVDVETLEQKLIQMELDTSRERAEIARERAALESKLEQLDHHRDGKPQLDESDYRFAAMRDHLREIHEEEKMIQLQKKQNSLSGRISRLLKGK